MKQKTGSGNCIFPASVINQALLFAVFYFLFALVSFPQSSTLEIHKDKKNNTASDLPENKFNRVMIIPFETKMYMSQIDKEISEKTGKPKEEIKEIFRKGIVNNVFIEAKMVHQSAYKSLSMYSEDPEIITDLDRIFKSIGYNYVPVHVPPDTSRQTAVASLKKATEKVQDIFDGKTNNKEEPGASIKNGQVHAVPENREKYMNTTMMNPDLLPYLSAKYECDYFIFINQLDLVIPPNTDYRDLGSDDYSRLVKVHYTILYKNGSEIYGDAVKTYISSRENDAQNIVNLQFGGLAKEIVSHLTDPHQTKAVQQKNKADQKKANEHRSSFDDY